jgi:hypothetical protein
MVSFGQLITERQPMKSLLFVVALVLFLAVFRASAGQKQLAAGHIPWLVAQGRVAPFGRLGATDQLRLAITLPVRDAGALSNLLHDIYSPGNPQFHHYLARGEFANRFGPTSSDYAAVENFANTNGFTIIGTHSNRLVVDVTGRVADIERAFHIHLNSFHHPTEHRNFFAPDAEPVVDARLPILRVSGLDNYSLPKPCGRVEPFARMPLPKTERTPCDGSGPGGTFQGNDFRQAYVPGTTLDGTGQNIALLQYDGFYPVDITNYAMAIGLTNVPTLVTIPVDGGVNTPGPHVGEVSLDIEMAIAMAPGISNIFVYEGPNGTTPWIDILTQMADDDFASQLSSSWGGGGPDPASEQVFQQMAVQGQSFFNASGDSDAFSGPIKFPAESPNITVVGGTALVTDGSSNYVSETVWNDNTNNEGSSGGIGTNVPIPVWQLGVDMTVANGSPVMRNIPDVALTASNIFIIYGNGANGTARGTSCAAPLWAGFTALINEQAGQLGGPAAGFLNPAIYGLCRGTNYPAIFHDIVMGNNTNSAQPTNYYAAPGYDLCTGWGTPKGTNLINLLTTPDFLGVSSPTNTYTGPVGGPFMPASRILVLTNAGPTSLNWGATANQPWLSIAPTNGTLPPYGSATVAFQFTTLPPGTFTGAIYVTNLALDSIENMAVNVVVDPSIVVNGGFETGDFTGWTLVGDTYVGNQVYNTVTSNSAYPGVAHSGQFGALLGEGGQTATLSQTLPTVPGQEYLLSFWLDDQSGEPEQRFFVHWNGTNLLCLSNPPAAFTWTNYLYKVTAADTNTTLEIVERNDTSYFGFDDVSVMAVPPVVFNNVAYAGGNLQFNWFALAGLQYQVLYTTNLATGNWQPLGGVTAATNICSLVDSNILGGDGRRFYQLVLP